MSLVEVKVGFFSVLVTIVFVILLSFLIPTIRSDKSRALEILKTQNKYTEAKIVGFDLLGCGNKIHFFHTKFVANTNDGKLVEGIICHNFGKNYEIEIN
ncbi:MAG: hypothetical protein LBH46_03350 [Rickettsiales bacterium]|jgi:hypothetical protein|nr:hypothetical protein [Rickettsiales bacterium]